MRKPLSCSSIVATILLFCSFTISGQTTSQTQKRRPTEPGRPVLEPAPPQPATAVTEPETASKPAANVVTIPVVATDAGGLSVSDIRPDEFAIFEDGVPQRIVSVNRIDAALHLVLLLDTSNTTEEKLSLVRNAAVAFVGQLQPADQVEVISFDDEVRQLNSFTSDRASLKSAIMKTRAGQATKLYDALGSALDSLSQFQGRRAIVLFTDGIDHYSERATNDGTTRAVTEDGVMVYTVRNDTRADSEREIRSGLGPEAQLPTIEVIRSRVPGTDNPPFPNDPDDPNNGPRRDGTIRGMPSRDDILRGRRRDPRTDQPPAPGSPDPPRRSPPASSLPSSQPPAPAKRPDGPLNKILDPLYLTADTYLQALADQSGGRLLRADTLALLPDALAKIAVELRALYAIAYRPMNGTHDGLMRKIKVTTTRRDVGLRAKPGYRAPTGD